MPGWGHSHKKLIDNTMGVAIIATPIDLLNIWADYRSDAAGRCGNAAPVVIFDNGGLGPVT